MATVIWHIGVVFNY